MSDGQAAPQIPTAQVGLLDVYTRQIEMGAQLSIIYEQLKPIADHEARIRALERFRFSIMGAAVAVSASVSTVATWVGLTISHHH